MMEAAPDPAARAEAERDPFDDRPTAPPLIRRYAPAPSGQVHYYDSLGSGPAVLLIHQSPTSAIDFCPVFEPLLVGGLRILALDLPGMGLSDPPATEPVIPDYAEAALRVLDHAGVGAAHMVGHHTGAAVAAAAAARRPERVGRLVLYGAPVLAADALARLWAAVVPAERQAGLFTPEPGGAHLASLYQRLEPRYGAAVANRMVLSRFLAGRRLWWGHNAALTWDMRADLAAARGPLLLITHPGEMLHEATLAAAALRPDARLEVLPYEGPLAIDGAPELWSETVLNFLTT